MHHYKYPNLSYGYIGKNHLKATINTSFVCELLQNISLLQNKISFPQRIPKTGYFEELCRNESSIFRNQLKDTTNTIKSRAHKLSLTGLSDSNEHEYINLLKLMLRFSLFDDILALQAICKANNKGNPEILFIYEIAGIEKTISLSSKSNLRINNLIRMGHNATAANFTTSLKLQIINRIIVYAFRHDAYIEKNILDSFVINHANEIKSHKEDDFTELLLKSICYRGLAMANCLPIEDKHKYLEFSEKIARNLAYKNKVESLAYKDNLSTFLQTQAKWNIQNLNYKKARECLEEICDLDPYDSVGYCEMGILLSKLEKYHEAKTFFKKAYELGAPGIGMNLYFYGKCLELCANKSEAIKIFKKSARIDPNAISPLIDIFFHYKNINMINNTRKLAKKILKTPTLKKQLSNIEIEILEKEIQC